MKHLLKVFVLIITIIAFSLFASGAFAQEPPLPLQAGHSMTGNQPSGGIARLGDGISILVAFALAFGFRKLLQVRTSKIKMEKPKNE